MPVIRKIMSNLKKRYGKKKGKNIYYAMENEGKLAKAKRTIAGRKHKKLKKSRKKRKKKQ